MFLGYLIQFDDIRAVTKYVTAEEFLINPI